MPDTRHLREHEDAAIECPAHEARDDGTGFIRPALRRHRHGVGPDTTDPQTDEEPQHQHLLLRPDERAHAGKYRVEKHADTQRPRPADSIPQAAQENAPHRRPQHERRREPCEPVAAQRGGVGRAQQFPGYGKRGYGH